jgi:hypothetical protein
MSDTVSKLTEVVKEEVEVKVKEIVKEIVKVKDNTDEIIELKKELLESNKLLIEQQQKYIRLLEKEQEKENNDSYENFDNNNYADISNIEITASIGQILDVLWIIILVGFMIYSIIKKGYALCSM